MVEPVVFGIETCDTVRRARQWLRAQGIAHRFHDLRRDGLARADLERWLARVPWDTLVNRRGTTWRRLLPAQRAAVTDQSSAIEALLAEPTLVRRPVVEAGDVLLVGFTEAVYLAAFAAGANAR